MSQNSHSIIYSEIQYDFLLELNAMDMVRLIIELVWGGVMSHVYQLVVRWEYQYVLYSISHSVHPF